MVVVVLPLLELGQLPLPLEQAVAAAFGTAVAAAFGTAVAVADVWSSEEKLVGVGLALECRGQTIQTLRHFYL